MQKSDRRGSPLFRKYFTAFAAIVLASFVFLGSLFMAFSLRYWTHSKQELLTENVNRIAASLEKMHKGSLLDNKPATLAEVTRSLLESISSALGSETTDFMICNAQGQVIACREKVAPTLLPTVVQCSTHARLQVPENLVERALSGNYTDIGTLGGTFSARMIAASAPMRWSGMGVPDCFVLGVQPLREGLLDYLGGLLQLFALCSLLVLFVSFLVIYYITSRLVSPLQEMVRATKQYANGNFTYRVTDFDDAELRTLGNAFNKMAVSLATLEGSRRNLVANDSHELKTPMTSIGGFVDGMLDGTIPPEKHPYYLQLVSQESKRLSRLVTGMLNLSKIEAGELKPKMTEFDISELLFQTVLLFEQLVAKKGIELIGLEDLRPLRITGDRDMLLQVFYNLLDNAVKFTPPGQQIIFETTVAPEDSKHTDGGRFFGFSLRNTGVGIGSDQLPRIFDRFYKTDSSRSYDTQSSGLGLYLVKTLVQLHGGSIKADSDGTAYTEFSLLLPI